MDRTFGCVFFGYDYFFHLGITLSVLWHTVKKKVKFFSFILPDVSASVINDNRDVLKSLELKNFQAHRNFSLEPAPGITTIRGRTDAGKSSVLRALRWLCLNDLSGEGFISHGSDFSYVRLRLRLPDGTEAKIVRKRGRANIYKLNGKVFRSFGSSVPEPVAVLLSLNEINFQRQHDAPFWFGSSAPEVSRQLNRVIDLSVIDSSLVKSAAAVRTARERITVSEERLREKKEQYELLEKQEKGRVEAFKALRELYGYSEDSGAAYHRLEGTLREFDQYPVRALEERAEALRLLLEEAKGFLDLDARAEKLGRIISLGESLERSIGKVPEFDSLEKSWSRYFEFSSLVKELELILLPAIREKETLFQAELRADKLKTVLEKERCPLCGRKNQ